MDKSIINKVAKCGDKFVLVSHTYSGQRGITCLTCNEELIVRKGDIKQHHFCHRKGSTCVAFSGCASPGETTEHYQAKKKIAERYNQADNMTITKKICFRCQKKEVLHNLTKYKMNGYFASIEYKYIDKHGVNRYADIAIIDNSGNIHMIIEICETHATLEQNREGCEWVELSAASVMRNTDDHYNCMRIPHNSCEECTVIINQEQQILKRLYDCRNEPDRYIDAQLCYLFFVRTKKTVSR